MTIHNSLYLHVQEETISEGTTSVLVVAWSIRSFVALDETDTIQIWEAAICSFSTVISCKVHLQPRIPPQFLVKAKENNIRCFPVACPDGLHPT